MSQLTYRIPNTGVFLQADGMVVPRPSEGATVLDVTPDQAPMLTAAYVGAGLRLMSEGSGDSIHDVGASSSSLAALEELKDLTENIVLIGDAIELGLKIAEWMGAFGPPEPNPLIAALELIDRRLSQIEDTVLAAWATSRRDMLAFLRAHSSTALRMAQEYLELGRPQSDFWANKIALADRDSYLAASTFVGSGIDGGFWLRPFSLKAIGIDPNVINSYWLGVYPDQAQIRQNPVWDYRFTLPATVYAIVVRIAVLKAVSPESLVYGAAGCREVRGYVRFLRRVAERMQSGIWALEDLDLSETGYFFYFWNGRMNVAAANIYSGYSFFRTLHASDFHIITREDPALWPAGLVHPHDGGGTAENVIARGRETVRLIGRRWWSLIWRGIGMVEMCQLISDIESACTRPLIDFVPPQVAQAQRMLLAAQTDTRARTAASVATALARFTSEGDAVADAARTFNLYQALRAGGEGAQQVVTRSTEELLRLAPPRPTSPSVRSEPVSWWRGEGDATDALGGNDGTIFGDLTFVSGRSGQAFSFSSQMEGFVEVPGSASLEPPTVTVAAWVRRNGSPGLHAYVLSKGAQECLAASYGLYSGGTGSIAGLAFYVSDGITYSESPEADPAVVWDGNWHFVAGTYDGTTVRLYIDGIEVGTGRTASISAIRYDLADSRNFFIGAYRGTCNFGFDGDVDEVQIFSRALTASEIQEVYNGSP